MNRTKLPIRERIGNIQQFLVGVDAVVAEILTVIMTIMKTWSKWFLYWLKAYRRWSTRTSRKGEDFSEKVPVPQILIRGTTEEILIGMNQYLENLKSQRKDAIAVMKLDKSDDEFNYALMENVDTEVDNAKLKTLENDRIKSENFELKKMNDHLEIKLLSMLELQKKDNVVYVKEKLLLNFGLIQEKLKKVQLKTIKFNPSADAVKSVNEVGSTSSPRSNLIIDKSEQGNWRNTLVLDSGCSGHMTGYKSLLSEFEEKVCPSVFYGDGNLGKILRYGKIKVGNIIIENVALVAGLKHNLISVSQIYDRSYHVNFYDEHCEIVSKTDGKIALTGVRHGSLYESRVSTNTDESEYVKKFKGRLESFSVNSIKPKNSIWKKIKKIMPQKNYEEGWS
ncbi:hypothetical protein AgCh_004048 [Apium graveolens]